MRRARIEVIKLGWDPEVKADWVKTVCTDQKVGQVFYTSGKHGDACPEGMCYLAWQSLQAIIQTLVRGGKMFGKYDSYTGCCPNAGRPVVYRIEIVDMPQ